MIFRSYTNDFHRQNSMGAVQGGRIHVIASLLARRQMLAQNQLSAPEGSFKTSQNSEQEELVSLTNKVEIQLEKLLKTQTTLWSELNIKLQLISYPNKLEFFI